MTDPLIVLGMTFENTPVSLGMMTGGIDADNCWIL